MNDKLDKEALREEAKKAYKAVAQPAFEAYRAADKAAWEAYEAELERIGGLNDD